MRNPKIKAFIKQHENLFWSTPADKKENISDELLVETILNYADLNAIKELFNIMGLEKVKLIFQSFKGRRRNNLYPEIYNFFRIYFKQHA